MTKNDVGHYNKSIYMKFTRDNGNLLYRKGFIMASIIINETEKVGHINPEIQGHFSEHLGRGIYEGLFVKEDSGIPNVNGMRTDVVSALKEMGVPLLRWPGGCFADEYHWMDGIGPKENRKKMVNTHWGGVTEDNSFGTHEFFELVRQLGCKTYINGNVGSGSVREMSEWVEYMTFGGLSPMSELRKKNGHEEPWKIDYFGVGNENWGCGGNMTPEYYGDLYRRYQTYIRQYDPHKPIKKVCGGPNVDDTNWMKKVCEKTFTQAPDFVHGFMDGISVHYYVHPGGWDHKGSATEFDNAAWYKTMNKALYIEHLINLHSTILNQYDKEKKVGLVMDEWGCWFDCEPGTNPGFLYQQNTMRDALVAGVTLNIFNNHCDRVMMACIAQMINVLQSVILTEGPKMIKTPTYHIFHMYKGHQDAECVRTNIVENPEIGTDEDHIGALQVSASVKNGKYLVTLANMDNEKSYPVSMNFAASKIDKVKATIVHEEMHAKNTFADPSVVTEKDFNDVKIEDGKASFTIPACSVVGLQIG